MALTTFRTLRASRFADRFGRHTAESAREGSHTAHTDGDTALGVLEQDGGHLPTWLADLSDREVEVLLAQEAVRLGAEVAYAERAEAAVDVAARASTRGPPSGVVVHLMVLERSYPLFAVSPASLYGRLINSVVGQVVPDAAKKDLEEPPAGRVAAGSGALSAGPRQCRSRRCRAGGVDRPLRHGRRFR